MRLFNGQHYAFCPFVCLSVRSVPALDLKTKKYRNTRINGIVSQNQNNLCTVLLVLMSKNWQ